MLRKVRRNQRNFKGRSNLFENKHISRIKETRRLRRRMEVTNYERSE